MQRLQHRSACADLVGQRRQAQLDAFAGIAFALPVERLMLAELLEQDHRQQVRPGKAARRDVERCRRLGDRLALAARELLAHCLDDLPLARDHLQRLGDILAELRQLGRAAAGAVLGCGDARRARAADVQERACVTDAGAQTPRPSCHRTLIRSPRRPRKTNRWPL